MPTRRDVTCGASYRRRKRRASSESGALLLVCGRPPPLTCAQPSAAAAPPPRKRRDARRVGRQTTRQSTLLLPNTSAPGRVLNYTRPASDETGLAGRQLSIKPKCAIECVRRRIEHRQGAEGGEIASLAIALIPSMLTPSSAPPQSPMYRRDQWPCAVRSPLPITQFACPMDH